jgi:protein-tyrosine phosphatase
LGSEHGKMQDHAGRMIDLHCHVLPGLDDGAGDVETSLAMARAAAADGVRAIVATPHVNSRYEVDPQELGRRVGELNVLLSRAEVPVAVLAGAEIAASRLEELSEGALSKLSLGGSSAVLIESPYDSTAAFLEEVLFALQLREYRPVLAHPERSPLFRDDHERLAALVERGIVCSINASSLAGGFGRGVQRHAIELLERGLVHDISSDAHDLDARGPELSGGINAAIAQLPGLAAHADWYLGGAAAALLADEPVASPPELAPRRGARLRRLVGR